MKKLSINKAKLSNITLILGIVVLAISLLTIIYEMINHRIVTTDATKPYVYLGESFKNSEPLFKFTNQTNILLGIAIIAVSLRKKSTNWQYELLYIANVLITITLVIYWALVSWDNPRKWIDYPFSSFLSVFVHLIHPIVGFVVLYWYKYKVVVTWKSLAKASSYLFGYFLFAMILYFITKSTKERPTVIYGFLNFDRPIYYKGGKLGVVIILDIVMFIIGIAIPTSFGLLWKVAYRLKMEKINFKFKKSKAKR